MPAGDDLGSVASRYQELVSSCSVADIGAREFISVVAASSTMLGSPGIGGAASGEVSLDDFIGNRPIHLGTAPEEPRGHDIVLRARLSLGECGYDLLDNNCEHF